VSDPRIQAQGEAARPDNTLTTLGDLIGAMRKLSVPPSLGWADEQEGRYSCSYSRTVDGMIISGYAEKCTGPQQAYDGALAGEQSIPSEQMVRDVAEGMV
jgi:hypothetical protein